ncbi:Na+/H+ antiporter subunit E [Arthrobacter sp. 179]|uniref:Na+/H+ antiporter subunit E n=1 Tax=Arthrobacter sp. 179 TaxID=3457734 RepID=UPI004033A574
MSPHRHPRPARPSELLTGARSARTRARRRRARFLIELPLMLWLVLVWGALWRDFSPGNLIFGFVIALGVVTTFKLPPVELSGRFNPWQGLVFTVLFLREIVRASIQVVLVVLRRGPKVRNAVIGIRMRSQEDLMATVLGHVLTLIPGSFVVEIDRTTSTLYLHVLDINTVQEAEDFRRQVRSIEARIIRMMGSREELAALDAEGPAGPDPAARANRSMKEHP